jgi:hypothetical protein
VKTEAAKRAQKKYDATRRQAGEKPLTITLSAKAHERLTILAMSFRTKRAVIESLLDGD